MSNLDDQLKLERKKIEGILSALAKGMFEAGLIGSKNIIDRSKATMEEQTFQMNVDKISGSFHRLTSTEIEIINTIAKRL